MFLSANTPLFRKKRAHVYRIKYLNTVTGEKKYKEKFDTFLSIMNVCMLKDIFCQH